MKEDVLEQILDDYLMHRGYFTRHNLKFKPLSTHDDFNTRKDSVSSDIDVIGFHPTKRGPDKVWVVSCKAWQGGFNPSAWATAIEQKKIISGREAWKAFRELCNKKWSEAFLATIEDATGTREFTYSGLSPEAGKLLGALQQKHGPYLGYLLNFGYSF